MENMGITSKSDVENYDLEYILSQADTELSQLANTSVLIVGAGGFLGYYFLKSLALWNKKNPGKKIQISALSIFRSGTPSWIQELDEEGLSIIKEDITTFSIPQNITFDYIVHAASIASPTYYRKYPIETIDANVQGLYQILKYMVAQKKASKPIKGMLYFSSSEIYGDPTEGNIPTPENYRGNVSCTGPRACYDESKRFCETLCVNYSQVYGLPIKTARPFNNYGPGMKITDGRVIADFARNILENRNIEMFSSGSPSRTFCYVADAIVGYLKILVMGKDGEAYNIGTEEPEISIKELGEKMQSISSKHFGYTGETIMKESQDKAYLTDNPQRRCPNIAKAKKELNYNPHISLEEGLYRTLVWYKEN